MRRRNRVSGRFKGGFRSGRTRWAWGAAGAALGVAVTGLVLALVSGGDGAPEPRAVSADEARRMALARFRTYEASPSEVVVRLPSGDGEGGTVAVRAVVDHRTHRAVGAYEVAEGGRTMRGLLAWDMAGMAVARPPRASTAVAPAAPARTAAQAVSRAAGLDAGQWARRGYRTAAPLDRSLRLVLAVAADRPDNARLLARSGPLWLRDERLDGHGYGVFAGPRPHPRSGGNAGPERPASDASGRSPLTYWIDADGNLRRIRARLAPGRETTVDFVAGRVKYGVPAAPWREAG